MNRSEYNLGMGRDLHLPPSRRDCEPPCSRRALLTAGTFGWLGGLAASRRILAADRDAEPTPPAPKAQRCLLVYLLGGPSHLDLWDMKPAAPAEVRGPFRPIDTTVPGLQLCEHLPRLAARAHRLTVLRSISFPNNDHPYMIYQTLTGHESPVPLGANTVLPPSRLDHPHFGAVLSRWRHDNSSVPGYVAIPEVQIRKQNTPVAGGGRAGFLGPRFDPLAINDDPAAATQMLARLEDVTAARLQNRETLLACIDGRTTTVAASMENSAGQALMDDYVTLRQSALGLVHQAAGGGLFDLEDEPAALRDGYGRHRFGQSLLLARRLVERGVTCAAVHFNHMTRCDGWDTHQDNFTAMKDELCPLLDQGLAALLDDLFDRRMLEDTLVLVMGEFGRTPKINAQAGRDHWGLCGGALWAGGGVPGGQVLGASDKLGAEPTELPVSPADVVASVYAALGIDPGQEILDGLGRPLRLTPGRPIVGLFG